MVTVYTISIIFTVILLLIIIELVKRNYLKEKYSLFWIFFGILLILFALFPQFTYRLSIALGIKYPPAVLFFLGLLFLIVYNLHLTVMLSQKLERLTRVIQEISILKEFYKEMKEKRRKE